MKKFTEGLIQVTLAISLLRTNDIHNYLNQFFETGFDSSEDIYFGSLSVYTRSSLSRRQISDDYGGISQLKNIERDYSTYSLLNTIHSLSRYRRFDGIQTDVHAWLVHNPAARQLPSETEASLPNYSADQVPIATQNNSAEAPVLINSTVLQSPDSELFEPVDFQSRFTFPGLDLSREDMDLIDSLWQQDIDLGISRNVYDVTYHKETENKTEFEFQSDIADDAKKRLESSVSPLPLNYTVDDETGELIAEVPADRIQQLNPQLSSTPTASTLSTGENIGFPFDEFFEPLPDSRIDESLLWLEENELQRTSNESQTLVNEEPNCGCIEPATSAIEESLPTSSYDELSWANQFAVVPQWGQLETLREQELSGNCATEEVDKFISGSGDQLQQFLQPFQNQSTSDQHFLNTIQSERLTTMERHWQGAPNENLQAESDDMVYQLLTEMNSLMQAAEPVDQPLANDDPHMFLNSHNALTMSSRSLSDLPNMTESVATAGETLPWEDVFSAPAYTLRMNSTEFNAAMGSLLNLNNDDMMLFDNLTSSVTGRVDEDGSWPASQSLLHLMDDNANLNILSLPNATVDNGLGSDLMDNTSNDSAISMTSPTIDTAKVATSSSPFDGLEGATGGEEEEATSPKQVIKYDEEYRDLREFGQGYYETSSGRRVFINSSDLFNDTATGGKFANAKDIKHNHTYPLPPSRHLSFKDRDASRSREDDKSLIRDERKAREMNLPFSCSQIIDSSVEKFGEMLESRQLSDAQRQLVRDIRRRGKNKMAAQNCRKRKIDVIQSLDDDVQDMRDEKTRLLKETRTIERCVTEMRDKMRHLQEEVLRSLRDDAGQPYDPNRYRLEQTRDGDVFLVPANATALSRATTAVTSSSDDHKEKSQRKRKNVTKKDD